MARDDDEDDGPLGGAAPAGAGGGVFDVLGDALKASPAFQQLVAQRVAGGRPMPWDRTDDNVDVEAVNAEGAGAPALEDLLSTPPRFSDHAHRSRPSQNPVWHKQPLQKARDWQMSLGPVSGAAGSSQVLTAQPRCYFRGEKIIATDTAQPPGSGTYISQLLVGRRLQRPIGRIPTSAFAPNALGSGIKMDTCQPAFAIAMTVEFVKACTFDATIFGKAVV